MLFETVSTGGCRSYGIGCEKPCAAALIDPELSQIDRYISLASRDGLLIRYLVDTHTHADHFSATRQLARQLGVPVVTFAIQRFAIILPTIRRKPCSDPSYISLNRPLTILAQP